MRVQSERSIKGQISQMDFKIYLFEVGIEDFRSKYSILSADGLLRKTSSK